MSDRSLNQVAHRAALVLARQGGGCPIAGGDEGLWNDSGILKFRNADSTDTLVDGAPSKLYVNASTGSDLNIGTVDAPLATLAKAFALWPATDSAEGHQIIMDADGVPRTYTWPTGPQQMPRSQGLSAAIPLIAGCRKTLVASQAETTGGSPNTFHGAVPSTTLNGALLAPTTLTASVTASVTTIPVADTTGYPSSGTVRIDEEQISYTSVNSTNFLGCTRGANSTTAASHAGGAFGGFGFAIVYVPSVVVTDASVFAASGIVQVDSEIIKYSGVSGNTLTGVIRGYAGSTGASHLTLASTFQFLAGHWVSITSAQNTTTLNGALSATATTIPVASVSGFPANALTQPNYLKIGSEIIQYSGVSGNSFTGCFRGYLGTTALAYATGTAVGGGNLMLQRRQIKSNTATTITTNTNYPANIGVGTLFTVNTAGTTVNFNDGGVGDSDYTLKDFNANVIALSWGPSEGKFNAQGINLLLNGNPLGQVSTAIATLGFGGTHFRMQVIWNGYVGLGAKNPFLAVEDGTGMRIEGGVTSPIASGITVRSAFSSFACLTFVNAIMQLDTNSAMSGPTITGYGGGIYIVGGADVRMDSAASTNRLLFQNFPFVVYNNSALRVTNADFNGSTQNNNTAAGTGANPLGSGIVCSRDSLVIMSGVGGTGNTGYGVEVADGGQVRNVDTASTVTGTLGDMKCGSRQARTWSDFNSATPASGLPSKNEYDLPGFMAKPVKLALSGLTATDTFNLAAPSAPATTVSDSPSVSATASTVNVGSTTGFASAGWVKIGSEVISYTGVTSTSFTGCSRGQQGTAAALHLSGVAILSWFPAAACVTALRVVTATANTGPYAVTDVGGTAFASAGGALGVATLSDDGTTLTFAAGTSLTALTIEYIPATPLASGSRVYLS